MSTVQIVSEVNIDLDKVLDGMAQLELTELERFALNVNSLVARRKAPNLPAREAELLQQINRGVPAAVRVRYELLNEKLLDETITPEEHQEFGTLVDQIEQADVERLQHLVELAQLRNISLDTLIQTIAPGVCGVETAPASTDTAPASRPVAGVFRVRSASAE